MSPRKLSDSDRKEIIDLYRNSEETTSTLALRYGVSSSTISRFLKSNLSDQEYEDLIQQKRLARTPHSGDPSILANLELDLDQTINSLIDSEPENSFSTSPTTEEKTFIEQPQEVVKEKENFFSQLLEDEEEDTEEDEEDDEEDYDDEEDDWDEDLTFEELQKTLPKTTNVQVLPLSEASLPRICYLVIDRTAELITRPLKEFADLGKIPANEVQQKTLPVFDSQKVAKRFSNRSQRVIKVPDGRMLKKTCAYLQAKGITRLLIDGQIYSLPSS